MLLGLLFYHLYFVLWNSVGGVMAATTLSYLDAGHQLRGWIPYLFGSVYWCDADKVCATGEGCGRIFCAAVGNWPRELVPPHTPQQKHGCLTHRHSPLIEPYRCSRYYFTQHFCFRSLSIHHSYMACVACDYLTFHICSHLCTNAHSFSSFPLSPTLISSATSACPLLFLLWPSTGRWWC